MSNQLSELRNLILQWYDLEELRTLSFDLGVNYDELSGNNISGKVRELLLLMGRRRQFDKLLTILQRDRRQLFDETNFSADSAFLDQLYDQLPLIEAVQEQNSEPPEKEKMLFWRLPIEIWVTIITLAGIIVAALIANAPTLQPSLPSPSITSQATFSSTPPYNENSSTLLMPPDQLSIGRNCETRYSLQTTLGFDEFVFEVDEEVEIAIDIPVVEEAILSFEGRIHNNNELAGYTPVFQILVNGRSPTDKHLKNKDNIFFQVNHPNENQRSTPIPYFKVIPEEGPLWGLFYSPNFSKNYTDTESPDYVPNNQAYRTELDVTEFILTEQINTITLFGREYSPSLKEKRPVCLVFKHLTLSWSPKK